MYVSVCSKRRQCFVGEFRQPKGLVQEILAGFELDVLALMVAKRLDRKPKNTNKNLLNLKKKKSFFTSRREKLLSG